MTHDSVARSRILIALVAGLSVPALSTSARPKLNGTQALARGIEAYEDLETEAALRYLRRAVQAEDLDPPSRAKAYLYIGLLRFEEGEKVAASRAFTAALRLDPEVAVPEGVSPKTRAQFSAVRKRLTNRRLEGVETPEIPTVAKKVEPGSVTVAEEQASRGDDDLTAEDRARGVVARGVDRGDTRVEASELSVQRLPDPEPETTIPLADASAQEASRDSFPWGWVGAGAGLVAVGLTAVLVAVAASQDSSECSEGAGGCVAFSLR